MFYLDLTDEKNIDYDRLNKLRDKPIANYVITENKDNKVYFTVTWYDNTMAHIIMNELKKEDLYEDIRNSKEVDISMCYIKDFSYNECTGGFAFPVTNFKADSVFWDGNCDFRNINIVGDYFDMKNCIFSRHGVDFSNSTFDAKNVTFAGANYVKGEVNFSYAKFGGNNVDFSQCMFECESVLFMNTDFGDGDVAFNNCKFYSTKVDFWSANFANGFVYFWSSMFDTEKINFFGSAFDNCSVYFSSSSFKKGMLDFSNAVMKKSSIDFSEVELGDMIVKFKATVVERVIFKDNLFSNHAYLNFKEIDELVIENCIIEKTMFMEKHDSHYVKFNKLSFQNSNCLGKILIRWKENNVENAIESFKVNRLGKYNYFTYSQKANQFLMFKENFSNLGYYDDEDFAYLAYKRNDIEAIKIAILDKNKKDNGDKEQIEENVKSINELWHTKERGIIKGALFDLVLFIKTFIRYIDIYGAEGITLAAQEVLDYIGRYAINPVMIIKTILKTHIFFITAYTILFILYEIVHVNIPNLKDIFIGVSSSIYFSMITFFTVGYGDISQAIFTDAEVIRWVIAFLSAAEGAMGVFLMSYLSVSIVRKTLR